MPSSAKREVSPELVVIRVERAHNCHVRWERRPIHPARQHRDDIIQGRGCHHMM